MNIYQIALAITQAYINKTSPSNPMANKVDVMKSYTDAYILALTNLNEKLSPILQEEAAKVQAKKPESVDITNLATTAKEFRNSLSGRSAGSFQDNGIDMTPLLLAGMVGYMLGNDNDTTGIHNSDNNNVDSISDSSVDSGSNSDWSSSSDDVGSSSMDYDSGGSSDFGGGGFD